MMNAKQLAAAYDRGELEAVATDLYRYGTIESFARFGNGGMPERITIYRHKGKRWEVYQAAGEVKSLSWEPANAR